MTDSIKFVVSGQDVRAPLRVLGGDAGGVQVGKLVHSVRLYAATRSSQSVELRVEATRGRDVVVLHIEGGPPLLLHPDNAADLLREQVVSSDRSRAMPADEPGTVLVPQELRWPLIADARHTTRGRFGGALLKALEIFRGPFELGAAELIANRVAKAVVAGFDGEVDQGLYKLDRDDLKPLKGLPKATFSKPSDGKPMLVLIHGTFSSTHGTFQQMWRNQRNVVRQLFDSYGSVYAFDHQTLGQSPLENALQLVNDLPEGANVHFITHSRGGLVAETIARATLKDEKSASFSHAEQTTALEKLRAALAARKIKVERVVRVACPARGTLLAGRRLDAVLSIFRWGLHLAGLPLADPLFHLLGLVAQARADVERIPGLEAMIPRSEFVRWLHGGVGTAEGELRVVAGDLEGDSLLSWLKALPADLLFWTDNDLVVHTRSMYGGTPRATDALFFFARGSQVSHFSYFHGPATAEAVLHAAISNAPVGFHKIGMRSWSGKDSSGLRGEAAATAPVLFFIPGLDGSGSPAYQPLLSELARTHEIVCFDPTWEAPLQQAANTLQEQIEGKLREAASRAIRIITHGAGGLVVRALLANKSEWWKSFMSRAGARVVFVACPHRGYWSPMQLLAGGDQHGSFAIDSHPPFDRSATCARMSKAVGLLQLQAELDSHGSLRQRARWEELAKLDQARLVKTLLWHSQPEQRDALTWCVPDEETLRKATEFWTELASESSESALSNTAGRLVQVLGHASRTPVGYQADPFEYLSVVDGGDGRVTDASAWLPDVKTWRAACGHEELTFHAATVRAYTELLQTGETRRLASVDGAPRVSSVIGHVAESRGSTFSATSYAPTPLAGLFEYPGSRHSLTVEVVNGDLRYVREALLLGHYRSARLTGSEAVVDALIGGTMTQALVVGAYPSQVGSNKIFVNRNVLRDQPHQMPKPQAAIIVGLGDEGKLTSASLAATVCQGVLAWSHRLIEMGAETHSESGYVLAATLVGSGGSGVHVGQAAQLVAQGVRAANSLISELPEPWPLVDKLLLIELYLDRATEAWNALKIQAEAAPLAYHLAPTVRVGSAPLKRPTQPSYRGARYDFISATSTKVKGAFHGISYTMDTRRARTEVRAQITQLALLKRLLLTASNDPTASQIGLTLFRLLIPREMQPFLTGSSELLLELDEGTAGIPWELLNDDSDPSDGLDAPPWAIRSKLIRKLRTTEFRERVEDADGSHGVLVIGEPACSEKYRRLPGARREASAVVQAFRNSGRVADNDILAHIADDDRESCPSVSVIVQALLNRKWRVVHIAGHGEPKRGGSSLGGIVAEDHLIGPTELAAQAVTPELVFLNCCHLANRDDKQLLATAETRYDRVQFAADISEQLIRNGVRCVIAAGWAVNDAVAHVFATSFYEALVAQGRTFADAVAQARARAREGGGDTWAAYQCYGDPEWTFQPRRGDALPEEESVTLNINSIASADTLILVLDEITSRATEKSRPKYREKVERVENAMLPEWEALGRVQEALGKAWNQVGERGRAIQAYERAVRATVDQASFYAIEQLSNLLVRQAASLKSDPPEETREQMLERGIQKLELVTKMEENVERLALCGSAYKRKAMLLGKKGDHEGKKQALKISLERYTAAQKLAAANNDPTMFYPGLNELAIELVVAQLENRQGHLDPALCASIVRCMENNTLSNPDFWTYSGLIEIVLLRALADGTLAAQAENLIASMRDLYGRDSAPGNWGSVRDQLSFLFEHASDAEIAAAAKLRKMVDEWSK